jgi:hypothetical protein
VLQSINGCSSVVFAGGVHSEPLGLTRAAGWGRQAPDSKGHPLSNLVGARGRHGVSLSTRIAHKRRAPHRLQLLFKGSVASRPDRFMWLLPGLLAACQLANHQKTRQLPAAAAAAAAAAGRKRTHAA